jgi:hypothetical protein
METSSTRTSAPPANVFLLMDKIAKSVPTGAGTEVPSALNQTPPLTSGRLPSGILITRPVPRKLKSSSKYERTIDTIGFGDAPILAK